MSENKGTIWVITQPPVTDDGTKSALPSLSHRVATKAFEISNDLLADRLGDFFKSFDDVLRKLPKSTAGFSVDEVELTLTVNASGGVELVGQAEAGITSGLKFTLKRIPSGKSIPPGK